MKLTSAQMDRACGVLLASAVGDALGAGYEFGSAPYTGWPEMIGGGLGGFAAGGVDRRHGSGGRHRAGSGDRSRPA